MMDAICAHIHNWFAMPGEIRRGSWTIADGTLPLDFLASGQYFRILGSALNDGVYRYPAEGLEDEVFTGEIWPMKVPKAVKELAAEIAAWQEKYGAASASPFSSEHFGSYSYTKARSYASAGGGMESSWQSVFEPRLKQYRKLY